MSEPKTVWIQRGLLGQITGAIHRPGMVFLFDTREEWEKNKYFSPTIHLQGIPYDNFVKYTGIIPPQRGAACIRYTIEYATLWEGEFYHE